MNGSQLLVQCLRDAGARTVFGMPGGHTAGIYDALRAQSEIRHILFRNENAGAMMADAYSRASGRPGVCLVAAGPGLTNSTTGLGTAYVDSVPMLAISGQIPRAAIGANRGYFHEMDATALTAPLTKWNATARSADDIPALVQRAFQEMSSGRPRPVHLDLPVDVLAEATSADPLSSAPLEKPAPTQAESEQAAQLLSTAKRPLIIAGGGVVSANAGEQLLELAERLGAPILLTPMGQGSVPADHPQVAGSLFHAITSDLSGMEQNLSALPEHADCVLAVGCRFSQLATGNWALRLPEALIQIDIDPEELGRNYPVALGICADAAVAVGALLDALKADHGEATASDWSQLRTSLPARPRWKIDGFDIAPVLRRVLDRDAIIACDVTRLYYMLLANFPVYEPRTLLHPSCFITLGYGIPAAIGAKAAHPDRQVVSVCGDGGFLMTAQELACAVQEDLKFVTVLINDNCLSAIKGIQNRTYGGRHMAVDLVNPDFMKLAEAYGVRGTRVTRMEQFEPALCEALAADRSTLIEVKAPQTAM